MSDEEDGYLSPFDDNPGERMALIQAELAAREKEALDAIKEDICEWLSTILNLTINPELFLDTLDTGVLLCQLASLIQRAAKDLEQKGETPKCKIPPKSLSCSAKAEPGSFFARDNASNFIEFCRKLGVEEAVIFESEGLVLHRDEKRVILCLLDVARFAERVGISPPQLVRMEREIEELEANEFKEMDIPSPTVVRTHIFKETLESPNKDSQDSRPEPPTHSVQSTDNNIQKPTAEDEGPITSPSQITNTSLSPHSPKRVLPPSRIPVRVNTKHTPHPSLSESKPRAVRPSAPRSISITRTGIPVRRSRSPVAIRTRSRRMKRPREEDECQNRAVNTLKRQRREVVESPREDVTKDSSQTRKETVDEKVMRRVNECTCSEKFKVHNCGKGKFIVQGASGRKMTVYARLLSDRVMVRVGGGWDSLDHFLLKHDPLAGRKSKAHKQRPLSPQQFLNASGIEISASKKPSLED